MVNILKAYKQIQGLRERYYKTIVEKESLLKMIAEAEVSDQVYNSNAIENSTLSFEETDKILLQIELDRYITEREIFEAKNLARVVTYIESKSKESELNFDIILSLHKMLISNICDDIAGRFRKENEWVRVGDHIAPNPLEVPNSLQKVLTEYNSNSSESIIKRIAKFHLGFEYIHPFCDGNGRIGRILNNYLLIRGGYVPINIKFIDRAMYYDAFKEFQKNGATKIMETIVVKALTNSYHKRLAYLENKAIISLSDYAKEYKLSHANLINKAKRQTIEAFTERGVWKIGINKKA
ncbi:MAG: Fic family protein [Bacteroidales bacterium]|nr:Fic family protein [Bacteroidales bacterium]